ncbi:MAG: hypothetical protein ACLTSZ_06260 [Lachnospiraceae bacterium]
MWTDLLRPASVVELAKQQNIQLPTEDLEELTSEYLQVSEDCTDLVACLKRFELPVRILGTPEAIRRAAFDLTEDLAGENYEYAEIRFAPQYANRSGLQSGGICAGWRSTACRMHLRNILL